MFGSNVQFNIGGKHKITSVPGLILTTILTLIILAYATVRFQVMIYQENPSVTQSTLTNYFDSSKHLNFKDINYRIAWAVESYTTPPVGKDDPDYV